MGLIENFKAGLYEEHLDEVSFLYEQRSRWREDPSLCWEDVHELEQRLEAHLDGLFLGGELARKLATRLLDLDEPGSLFGTLALCCRLGAVEQIKTLVEGAGRQLRVAEEALCLELLPEQRALVFEGLASSLPEFWARVIGFQGLPYGRELLDALDMGCTDVVWALGELQYAPACERLLALVERSEPQLAAAAAIALGKLQGQTGYYPDSALPEHPLLLQGSSRHEQLAALACADSVPAITALGLEGDPRSVPVLIELLAAPPLAAACAEALHLITGAGLLEIVSVAMEGDVDPDLVSDSSDDDAPERATIRRLSQNNEQWLEWLRTNPLTNAARVRMGRPLGLASTVSAFTSTAIPLRLRRLVGDELRIRTRHGLPLQPELPVVRQQSLVVQLRRMMTGADWSSYGGGL